MPRGQPFTRICQQYRTLVASPGTDLHLHTHASDGDLTPSQVVALAYSAGLAHIAITDHDTVSGLPEAVRSADAFQRRPIRILAGVELSTTHNGRDYHLLGYRFDADDSPLGALLATIREQRERRFRAYLDIFQTRGFRIQEHDLNAILAVSTSLGRRHLALLLIRAGIVHSQHEAFQQYLLPMHDQVQIRHTVPMAEAIRIVHDAGGITSLAHPSEDVSFETLSEMQHIGMDAVEAVYPAASFARTGELRTWAQTLGLAITGGSDFHGYGGTRRPGSPSLPLRDFERTFPTAGRESRAHPSSPTF